MGDAAFIPSFDRGDASLIPRFDVVTAGAPAFINASTGTFVVTGSDIIARRWWFYSKAFLLKCEGSFGERASLELTNLPQLNIETRVGSKYSENLPAIGMEGAATAVVTGSVSSVFPELQVEIRTSHGVLAENFPEIRVDVTVSTPVLCNLSRSLPGLSATGSMPGGIGSLNEVLGVLSITANAAMENTGSLASSLPGLKGRIKTLSGATGAVSSVLPDLQSEATIYSVVISLSSYLPVITPGLVSGDTGGLASNTMTNEDRFDDTLLRYQRWA